MMLSKQPILNPKKTTNIFYWAYQRIIGVLTIKAGSSKHSNRISSYYSYLQVFEPEYQWSTVEIHAHNDQFGLVYQVKNHAVIKLITCHWVKSKAICLTEETAKENDCKSTRVHPKITPNVAKSRTRTNVAFSKEKPGGPFCLKTDQGLDYKVASEQRQADNKSTICVATDTINIKR